MATGVPSPFIFWVKVGSGRRTNGSLLQLTNISRSQAGEYRCEASNECGNAVETVNIVVPCKLQRCRSCHGILTIAKYFCILRRAWNVVKNSWIPLAWKNSRLFATPPLVSPRNDVLARSGEFPHWWCVTTQSWVVLGLKQIGWSKLSTNQEYYLDLGSDTSSVWNFCAHSSDFILQASLWWRREMSALFSG